MELVLQDLEEKVVWYGIDLKKMKKGDYVAWDFGLWFRDGPPGPPATLDCAF